ncbi:MAG TPA: Holliday junction branch migration protein RuvA [Bacilli bacterium]|nr:Holliday junction branch migration protein RuvA [Bacilli bacterium]
MYNYIIGKITDIKANYIVLESNSIGYEIKVANPYAFEVEKNYKVYIYTHVREDEYTLYGFKSEEEKDLFLKLINVKGIGPKMALPVLATGSVNGIYDAINRENILYLTKFPKIGEKVARQIILDLKGKIGKQGNILNSNNFDELINVLESLGYKNGDIKKVLPNINTDLKIEDQVKEALKLLMK